MDIPGKAAGTGKLWGVLPICLASAWTLTSKEEIAEIAKNIKKYEKQCNAFDEAKKRKLRLQETKGKRKSRSEFRDVMAWLAEWRARQKVERVELLGGYDSDDEENYTTKEVTIETVLNTKEDLVY